MNALDGIRVLDLSRVLAGPWSTQILADLGADVVKVERRGTGDDTRNWGPPFLRDAQGQDTAEAAYYLGTNRNKRSITCDISHPEGQALLRSLAMQSHVFIENFKVGDMARYGLDYASLHALNPRLVYCSITGFGQTGPYSERAGYDFVIQGMSGLMSVTGDVDGEPAKVGVAIDGLANATQSGVAFVFGFLAGVDPQPYSLTNPGALFVFGFRVLPVILVVCALAALLWHWRILKWITRGFGFLFQKTMGLGGASALATAANIFLGMVETPIIIKGYLDKLSRAELFMMMVVGLATVAGSTMVAYAMILKATLPNAAAHVLVASIVSAPAGVLLARIMIPEKPGEGGAYADYSSDLLYDSSIDAISKGVADGLQVNPQLVGTTCKGLQY
jgi:hypothetical protein